MDHTRHRILDGDPAVTRRRVTRRRVALRTGRHFAHLIPNAPLAVAEDPDLLLVSDDGSIR
jgi:hypothetical protein